MLSMAVDHGNCTHLRCLIAWPHATAHTVLRALSGGNWNDGMYRRLQEEASEPLRPHRELLELGLVHVSHDGSESSVSRQSFFHMIYCPVLPALFCSVLS